MKEDRYLKEESFQPLKKTISQLQEISEKMGIELPCNLGIYVDRKALIIYVRSLLLGFPWEKIPLGEDFKKQLIDSFKIFTPGSSLAMESDPESGQVILATIIRAIVESRDRAGVRIDCDYGSGQPDDLDYLFYMPRTQIIQLGIAWLESNVWISGGHMNIFGMDLPKKDVKKLLETSLAIFQKD